MFFKAAGVAALICLAGCASSERMFSAVTDQEKYYDRTGFSVTAPSGTKWYKFPIDDKHPNLIMFAKQEGLVTVGAVPKFIYMKGRVAVAASTLLDEPVSDRKDTDLLAATLRDHLRRYQPALNITNSGYDSSLGQDCLKYSGTSKVERFKDERGDLHGGEITGYLCLHPVKNDFGVIMESRNIATVWTETTGKDTQSPHFFSSLRFNPVSSAVSRTFKSSSYQVGKGPCQIAPDKGNLWVVLKDENRVIQMEPGGKILASFAVGSNPVALAVGHTGVWVANSGDGTLTRLDPGHPEKSQTIAVGGKPVAISLGGGFVWVADSSGNVVLRINPATNLVAARIAVGLEPVSVATGTDGIWIANAGDGTVSRIDRFHDWAVDVVKVGGRPVHVSLADTGAWVADESGKAVVRIDRKSKEIIARIPVSGKPAWVQAYDGWDLFVALSDVAKVVRIDPKLSRVFGPPIPGGAEPRSMVMVGNSLWLANSAGTTLTKAMLDPTGQAISSLSAP